MACRAAPAQTVSAQAASAQAAPAQAAPGQGPGGPGAPGVRAAAGRVAANPALQAAAIILVAVAADAATKAWARDRLSDGRHITVAGGLLRLQLVINHGAAFGLGARYEVLLSAVALAGFVLLAIWAVRGAGSAERLGAALAAAGAAGNLIDRLIRPPAVLHGGVTDWLHVSFYGPTFNLADVWLRAGLIIAAAGWLWHRRTRVQRGDQR
jgi:signal peptidase II